MHLRPAALLLLWGTSAAPLLPARAEPPSTNPARAVAVNTKSSDPSQQSTGEIAALQTSLALLQISQAAPTVGEIAAARKVYEDLIARYPAEAEPHAIYGEYLRFISRKREAVAQWDLVLTIDPRRHDVLAAKADLLLQTGQVAEAADAWEKAAGIAPENAYYQYSLAHVYTLFRRDLIASRHLTEDELITRGTAYFRRAAELEPNNLVYAQAYAEAFYTEPKPDWRLARAAWEALLPRSSQKDFIHGHLARVSIRLKDKAAATEHLTALTDPAFSTLKARLQLQVDKL